MVNPQVGNAILKGHSMSSPHLNHLRLVYIDVNWPLLFYCIRAVKSFFIGWAVSGLDQKPVAHPWFSLYTTTLSLSTVRAVAVTSHEGSQIPRDRLVKVISLLQALMLLMVISSLPNLLTAWSSVLYCPSNQTLHECPRAHVAQHFYRLCNCTRKQSDGLY